MSRAWTFRTLSAAVVLVIGLATCAVGVAVWIDRTQEIRSGVRGAHDVAVVLAGQLGRSLQAVDIVLRELQTRIDSSNGPDDVDAPRIDDTQAFRELMRQRLGFLPQAFGIAVTDSRGRVIVSTAGLPASGVDVADREYFLDLAANDDDRLSAPLPVLNRVDGEKTIAFARRLNAPDHRFLGVVFVSLRPRYFEQIYNAVEGLQSRNFALTRTDGRMFVRFPDVEDRTGLMLPASSPWYATVAKGGGVFRSLGVFDSVVRWVAVHPVRDFPFVAHIAVPEDVLLATWRIRTMVTVAMTLVFVGAALVLLYLMGRQYRSLSASEASLAEKSQALEREHDALQAHQAALQIQNQRFDAALNNMSQGLALFDGAARLVVCNERYRQLYGLSDEQTVPGTSLQDLIGGCRDLANQPFAVDKVVAAILDRVMRPGPTSHELSFGDGRIVAVANQPMEGGGWLSTHEDVTERRHTEEKIRRLAENDLLTGVANRVHFLERIEEARRRLDTERLPFSVLMLDLDRFKHVNDSLGHAAGDALLKELAARLKGALRTEDVLARLGGDEFAVIQTPPRDFRACDDATEIMRESAIVLASRIIDLIDQPFDIDGHKVVVGASIGIALAPKDAVHANELMKKADLALYAIKGAGRNGFAFFDQAMAATADERHRLEVDFREGLARNEFELYYQPLVDAHSRRVCGMEALVRWNHPDQGLIAPDRFIAMAEDTGLVGTLGEWILQTACAEAATWPEDVKIAINISPVQFRKTNLLDVIMCALVESGLSPERLEIEITERVLLEWEADHLSTLHQLKNLGISVALDDFGTGYSSLSYLTAFPFDKLKIDRSFTRDLLAHDQCGAIVCAIINLGRSLDMITVAEGVETEAQLQVLRAAGVHQVQGYLIGRPAPPDVLDLAPEGAAPGADIGTAQENFGARATA
jgi:diguanylate cyclase (GGDEF)-like protein